LSVPLHWSTTAGAMAALAFTGARCNRQSGGCEYGPALCGGAVVQSPPRQH
jgi:hypothetical protein